MSLRLRGRTFRSLRRACPSARGRPSRCQAPNTSLSRAFPRRSCAAVQPWRCLREVAVLDHCWASIQVPGPEIGADISSDGRAVRRSSEVVSAEAVVLRCLPGHVETLGRWSGADAIHPVVVGREVALPAAEAPLQVATASMTSRRGSRWSRKEASLVENAALDATAEVLGEVAGRSWNRWARSRARDRCGCER